MVKETTVMITGNSNVEIIRRGFTWEALLFTVDKDYYLGIGYSIWKFKEILGFLKTREWRMEDGSGKG